MNGSYQRWAFTAWSPPVVRKPELLQYLLYQSEYTCDEKVHYQGYVEFKKPYKQATVKSLFSQKSMHVEPAIESRSVNIMYCTKLRSYAGIRYCFDGERVHYENNPKVDEIKLTLDDVDDVFNLGRFKE